MSKRTTRTLTKGPTPDIPTLLLVEDNASIHKLVQMLVRKHNTKLSLHSAFTVHEAKEKVLYVEPDLLILDYCLPDGNASKLTDFMHEKNIYVPYIVITAYKTEELIHQLHIREDFIDGAEAIVFKPKLGTWFGEYIDTMIKLSFDSKRWIDEEDNAGAGC